MLLLETGMPMFVLTARTVTPKQATSDSSSMSPEQSSKEISGPPAAACMPAMRFASDALERDQVRSVRSRVPVEVRVTRAEEG